MTNINLLPVEQRKKELAEKKNAQKEKKRIKIDLSEPERALKEKVSLEPWPKGLGVLGRLKKVFGRDKTDRVDKSYKSDKTDRTYEKDRADKTDKALVSSARLVRPTAFEQQKVYSIPRQPERKNNLLDIHQVSVKERQAAIEKMKQEKAALHQETDKDKSKLSQPSHPPSEKFSLTPGSKVVAGPDVNLMPSGGPILEISSKTKIVALAVVLALLMLIFGGIFFWFNFKVTQAMQLVSSFDQRNQELKDQIKTIAINQQELVDWQVRLQKLDGLLTNHILVSQLFNCLEKNTLPGVYYSNIAFDINKSFISLQAVALDYTTAAKQILVFEQDTDNFSSVNLISLSQEKEKMTGAEKKTGLEARDLVEFFVDLEVESEFFQSSNK